MPPVTVPIEVPDLVGIEHASDREVIDAMRAWADADRLVRAGIARLAGVVAARSTLERGNDGLAQRVGVRTADALVSKITGVSGVEARQMVAVGTLLDRPAPWLGHLASRVTAGSLSVAAAAAITTGLGSPTSDVAADDLADAAHALVEAAGSLPPEKVARLARDARDELDTAGVADREQVMRDKRFLKLIPQGDGMTRLIGLLDPESAALVSDAVDCVTSPRRGGPRFVDPAESVRVERIVADQRTTEQIAVDALVDMVRIAGAADPGTVFGVKKPGVRIHVAARDLVTGRGAAHLEGQTAAISIPTVRRIVCSEGYLPVIIDDGAMNLGRGQRLFTDRQRTVLAAIWGGCAMPDCDRPPSWCEAHHIDAWNHGGRTDVDRGILLCRHHHLLLHNNRHEIRERDGTWWLTTPPGDILHPDPIPLEPKNLVHRRTRAG